MTPKRILFVTRCLSRNPGGMQLYTRSLIDGLQRRSDVTIIVVGYGGGRLGLPFFLMYAFLRSLFFRGTHIHFGDAVLTLFAPVIRCFRPQVQLSATVFGLDLTYRNFLYQWMLRQSLSVIPHIVAISNATKEQAISRGALESGVRVIPCGIDGDSIAHFPRRTPTIGSDLLIFGRQIPRKGTRWFLSEVLPELHRQMPDVRVTIAGNGPEVPAIVKDIEELKLHQWVRMFDRINDQQKSELYAQTSLFLMPNIPVAGDMEGFGIVILEASAAGVPTVAAKLEGIADAVIDGETGLFFEPHHSADCIRAIREALQKQWSSEEISAACKKHFNRERMISSYMDHVFR